MQEIFTVFGINWKLLLIQAFNFTVLLVALWYFLYRPVINILERRRAMIEKGIQDAESAEKKLAKINAEKEEILNTATNEGDNIILKAKQRAQEKTSEIISQAEKRADTILQDASARAQEEKDKAIKESEREVAKMAILAAEKILKTKI